MSHRHRSPCTVLVFRHKLPLEEAIQLHAFAPLEASMRDQWHSTRMFTPLTGSRCKLRQNTEGAISAQAMFLLTMNSVTTLMTSNNTEGTISAQAMFLLTMNSVTTLMTSHNTEGTIHCVRTFYSAKSGTSTSTVRVFRQKCTLEDAIGSHACSLEANMRVTNGTPLGSSFVLPVDTVNCIQTLKV
jgi:hypothetical protein